MREDRAPFITSHLAKFIKSRRKELGYSLDDLSERAEVSKTHLWDMESGKSKNPTLWVILALCDALSCSLNDLIGVDVAQPIFSEKEMQLIARHRDIFGRGE